MVIETLAEAIANLEKAVNPLGFSIQDVQIVDRARSWEPVEKTDRGTLIFTADEGTLKITIIRRQPITHLLPANVLLDCLGELKVGAKE
jgi:hypothetical protein